jgi:ABC-type lipoprotein export system ATPase subunit
MSIELKSISHSYDTKNYILKNFNLTIDKGEIVAIIGSSGSGKSTLLNIVGGINVPSKGEILLDGVNINNLKAKDVESFKLSKIGYIFQNYNLIPFLNVMDNILLPVNLLKKKLDSYKKEAIKLLKELNLESKANANILELSGGEQQRVAIARALILNPSIILADEPTGSLDRDNTTNFMKLLKEISIKRSISVMLVTHDLKVTEYATRVIDISK